MSFLISCHVSKLPDKQKKKSESQTSLRAIDGARTRGLDLGKVARYQLRHYRIYYDVFLNTKSIIHDSEEYVNTFFQKIPLRLFFIIHSGIFYTDYFTFTVSCTFLLPAFTVTFVVPFFNPFIFPFEDTLTIFLFFTE